MSRRMALGLVFFEKLLGIIIATIGAALAYYTYTSLSAAREAAFLFIGFGIALAVLGVVLVVARTG